ncbi:MAG: hypothetical protein HDT46_09140 [Ruminococcaceae bacterium]|nr:hypothetical protein [Oscillospiraceae bacterium]
MKNEEKLLYTIGEVDEKLVPSDKMKKSPLKWAVIGTSAAAAAIAGFVVMRGAAFSNLPSIISPFDGEGVDIVETEDISITDDFLIAENISVSSDIAPNGLPKIPYKSFCFNSGFIEESLGNMGYNSATSMIRDCPWSEEQGITAMPVYKNLSYSGDYVYPECYFNEEKMRVMAEEIAEALGVTIKEYDFFNDLIINHEADENIEYEPERNCLTAICDGESYGVEAVYIYIYGRGSIAISISDLMPSNNPNYMKLPEEYANDKEALSDYLMERFKDLINMENPSGSALDTMYNVTDDPVQNIVNYSLEPFEFHVLNNELTGMIIDKKLCVAEKVGDYEIITAEEAQSKLLNAYKDFELPDGWPDEWYDKFFKSELTAEDIESVTLFYKNIEFQEYFKPYYCFYVKASGWSPDNNWDVYQAFYVPALRDEYILN